MPSSHSRLHGRVLTIGAAMSLAIVPFTLAGCGNNSTDTAGQNLHYETASRSTSPEQGDDAEQETSTKESAPEEKATSKPVPPNVVMDEEEESQASQLDDENSSTSGANQNLRYAQRTDSVPRRRFPSCAVGHHRLGAIRFLRLRPMRFPIVGNPDD